LAEALFKRFEDDKRTVPVSSVSSKKGVPVSGFFGIIDSGREGKGREGKGRKRYDTAYKL
jgi:hypothetical protein